MTSMTSTALEHARGVIQTQKAEIATQKAEIERLMAECQRLRSEREEWTRKAFDTLQELRDALDKGLDIPIRQKKIIWPGWPSSPAKIPCPKP